MVCVDQCWTGYKVSYHQDVSKWKLKGFSSWVEVISGVPQGSVVGPVLFICYIDMPDMITSFIYMYADDATVMNCVSDEFDQTCLTVCSLTWTH